MPTVQDVVRTITIRGKQDGVDALADSLKKLSDAQGNVSVSSDKVAKTATSVDAQLAKLERRYIDGARGQQDYVKLQAQLAPAIALGGQSQERANAILASAAFQYGTAGAAARAFHAATSGVSGQLVALSAGAGPVGTFLAALGPWGVAAAIGLGGAATALGALNDIASKTGQRSLEMRNFAESTGFTIDQVRALKSIAGSIGIETDKVQQWIERMGTSLSDVRDGVGPLADRIHAINPDLLLQIELTRNNAQAWDLLAKSAAGAGLSVQKFLRELAGKGSAQLGLLFGATDRAGGLDSVVNKTREANTASTEITLHWAETQNKINEVEKRIERLSSMLFPGLLDEQLKIKQAEERIVSSTVDLTNSWRVFVNSIKQTPQELAAVESASDAAARRLSARYRNAARVSSRGDHSIERDASLQEGMTPASAITQAEKLAVAQDKVALSARQIYENAKRMNAELGTATTIQEKWDLALLKVNSDLEKRNINMLQYMRLLDSNAVSKDIEKLGMRNSALGAGATVADLVRQRYAELERQQQQLIGSGSELTSAQIANSRRLIQAQADGTFALQAQIDATNVNIGAMGRSIGAAETYRIIQSKINENLNAGKSALDGISESYLKLAAAAGVAKQQEAQLSAQKKADFDLSTVFMTDIDRQIAAVQYSLHGDGWRAFMDDGLAATMRLSAAMNDLSNTSRDALKGMATDIRTSMQAGSTFVEAMSKATVSALNKIADKLMQMAIDQLWAKAFGGSGFNILSLLGIGGGGTPGGAPVGEIPFSAMGNVFDQGRIIHPYALGGLVSDILVKPTLFPMANGIGLAGEAGPEAIMPLRRGSDGRLGVQASGGGGGSFVFAPVYNIDATGSNITEEQFMAILDKNNRQLAKDIDRSLPDRVAQITRDPRRRG